MQKWKSCAMVDAYIGLGSNLGNRRGWLVSAILQLQPLGTLVAVSSLWESEPIGGPQQQGWYLNMVARLCTPLAAHPLLDALFAIEQNLGRVRTIKNGPRTIDLDLLLWGNLTLQDDRLILPHPRMAARRFVIEPLAEVHPNPQAIVGMDFYRAVDQVKDQRLYCLGSIDDGSPMDQSL